MNFLTGSPDDLLEKIKHTELYNDTFCASIDLLGTSSLLNRADTNLIDRLYNLYYSFQAADQDYPLSNDVRVCYIADSIWLIREFTIKEPNLNLENEWKTFCGQIYLISSDISIHENFGEKTSKDNPCGIRVIISYGKTYDIFKNETWKDKNNWYALTGPNTALIKCDTAEKKGEKGGFKKNYCFAEIWGENNRYKGCKLQCQKIFDQSQLFFLLATIKIPVLIVVDDTS